MIDKRYECEKKEIGAGKQARVYFWNGFAYKQFEESYPKEWIEYEIQVQKEISKTKLPVVKYYKTESPYIIKMDYINGISLGERIQKRKYKHGIEDLLTLQKQVHQVENIDIPILKHSLEGDIIRTSFSEEMKIIALKYLSDIGEKPLLCHLDFHPMNIMYSVEGKYYIVDWVNAKVGNPIFDYARTYVTLYEFTYRILQKYLSLLKCDEAIDVKDIEKTIFISALLRTRENGSNIDRLRQLLKIAEQSKLLSS